MSRAKGYKCFNIKCGSCIGKTLCGEPEDTALVCVDRVIGKPMTNADRIRAMSDEELAEFLTGGVASQTGTTIPTLRNARRVERDGSSSQRRRLTMRLPENERTVMTDGYQNRRLS